MSVRIVFPKTQLAALLRAPGGAPVIEALEKAQANLETLKPECQAELKSLVDRILAAFEQSSAEGRVQSSSDLYALASGGVGLGAVAGMPAADITLVSLCKLVDHLQARDLWDNEAIAVHVRTLSFLVTASNLTPQGVQALLQGLESVNRHYRPADAPQ